MRLNRLAGAWLLSIMAFTRVVQGESSVIDPAQLTFHHSFDSPDMRPERVDVRDHFFKPSDPFRGSGRFGQAARIAGDGHGAGYRIGASRHINPEQGTITFWIRPQWDEQDASSRVAWLFGIINNDAWSVFNLRWSGEHGRLYFSHWSSAAREWSYEPSVVFDPGPVWRHVSAVWESTEQGLEKRLYIDGVQMATARTADRYIDTGADRPQLTIGSNGESEGTWFDGWFDDFAVWSVALSAGQIRQLAEQEVSQLLGDGEKPRGDEPSARLSHSDVSGFFGVIHEREVLRYQLHMENPHAESRRITVEREVEDFYGERTALESHPVDLPPNGRVTIPLTVQPRGFGIFKVRDRVGTRQAGPLSFACLPSELAQREGNPDSSFGSHVHADPDYARLARILGVKWTLLKDGPTHYTNWWSAQPAPDEFRFFDEEISHFRSAHIRPVGCLFRTPPWASATPAKPSALHTPHPPDNLEDFQQFVRTMVSHYRNTICCWEIWNEPHVPIFWSGTPEDYVDLLKAAHRAARDVDPGTLIIGGGGLSLSDRDFVQRALDAGMLDALDVLSIHGYSDAVNPIGETQIEQELNWLRQQIRARSDREIPIWMTEFTTLSMSMLDQYAPRFPIQRRMYHYRTQSARLVREHVVAMAGGVERLFYYWFWPPHGYFEQVPINGATTEPTGTPKPVSVAYAILAWMIDGRKYVGEIVVDRSRCRLHIFHGDDGAILVAWALEQDVMLELPANPSLRIYNLMGNPAEMSPDCVRLSSEPLYIHAPGHIDMDELSKPDLWKLSPPLPQ